MQRELFGTVEKLQKLTKGNIGENHGLEDTFVFDLSSSIFPNYEVKVLERGLDFAPTQQKIKESELRKDFHVLQKNVNQMEFSKWTFTRFQ